MEGSKGVCQNRRPQLPATESSAEDHPRYGEQECCHLGVGAAVWTFPPQQWHAAAAAAPHDGRTAHDDGGPADDGRWWHGATVLHGRRHGGHVPAAAAATHGATFHGQFVSVKVRVVCLFHAVSASPTQCNFQGFWSKLFRFVFLASFFFQA